MINTRDFLSVAAFCSNYIKNEIKENPDCYNWFSYSNRQLNYNGEFIEISEELQESILKIENAFPDEEAYFDVIRCYEDTVHFCTQNGQYALVYSPYKKPVSVSGTDKEDVFVKRAKKDWYHVVKNNH